MDIDIDKNWLDVPPVWRSCFELAWECYLEGSNPIGALVVDADGHVVATGKSAVRADISDVPITYCEIAHAEVNALLKLDNRTHNKSKAQNYTLYVSLEPCPLCFSALYMSDVKKLKFAAKDRYGGSTNLIDSTPYMSTKTVEIDGPVSYLEDVSIFLNVYYDARHGANKDDPVHSQLAKDYPKSVQLAQELGPGDSLAIEKQTEFGAVYQAIAARLR